MFRTGQKLALGLTVATGLVAGAAQAAVPYAKLVSCEDARGSKYQVFVAGEKLNEVHGKDESREGNFGGALVSSRSATDLQVQLPARIRYATANHTLHFTVQHGIEASTRRLFRGYTNLSFGRFLRVQVDHFHQVAEAVAQATAAENKERIGGIEYVRERLTCQ